MSTTAAPRAPAGAVAGRPTLSIPAARGVAFFALAAFGALHWMVLLEPAQPVRAVYALLAAAGVAALLLAAARLDGRLRPLAAAVVAVAGLAFALLAGGVADELLRPDRWSTLAAGIGRGIESLPGVRVPYRGLEEWTRAVLGMGGTVLVVAAAVAAFWPRRRGTGQPAVALGLLVALYAIPAVALDFENEFLRGAALALLVVAFLRLEKLRVGDAGTAGMVAAGAAVAALMLAPALDGDEPWWDYESWALGAASARSTAFSWDHSYGPLDWPRDGRELLRVRAEKRPAYWKAANLSTFDGLHWRQSETSSDPGMPTDPRVLREGTQRISVTIGNLSSRSYVTAGYAIGLDAPTVRETMRDDGTWAAGRALRRGDAYAAEVYTPQTDEDERRAADYDGTEAALAAQRRVSLPGAGTDIGQTGVPYYVFDIPRFEDQLTQIRSRRANRSGPSSPLETEEALTEGPYRRTWALAQELKDESESQEDFVQAVMRHLRRGYGYSETPPPAAYDLDGFLFDAKSGYCQQFSGAMALLLRMGGVPARVVTGFTSGSLDSKTKEYVVRDLDAHSWVEVWYGGIGWVTFDPTPALAPPRAQPDEAAPGGGAGATLGAPDLGGDRPADPGRRALAEEPGTPWGRIALGAAAALALAAAAFLLARSRRRRRGTPPAAIVLADLERALRRSGVPPGPGTTLRALEQRFSRSPAAAGYVRAVRELRYGGRAGAPTAAQRRGLRAELGHGGGLAGRLRAWWALPPRGH